MKRRLKVGEDIDVGIKYKKELEEGLQRRLNKRLNKLMLDGDASKVKDLVESGASLAYENHSGVYEAAMSGHMGVFRVFFEEMDFKQLFEQDLVEDAVVMAEESGELDVAEYLRSKIKECPVKIVDKNMNGFD